MPCPIRLDQVPEQQEQGQAEPQPGIIRQGVGSINPKIHAVEAALARAFADLVGSKRFICRHLLVALNPNQRPQLWIKTPTDKGDQPFRHVGDAGTIVLGRVGHDDARWPARCFPDFQSAPRSAYVKPAPVKSALIDSRLGSNPSQANSPQDVVFFRVATSRTSSPPSPR